MIMFAIPAQSRMAVCHGTRSRLPHTWRLRVAWVLHVPIAVQDGPEINVFETPPLTDALQQPTLALHAQPGEHPTRCFVSYHVIRTHAIQLKGVNHPGFVGELLV
jgi:hypothetical protein